MVRSILVTVFGTLLVAGVLGCGEKVIPPEQAYKPEALAGKVDESLPQPLRDKQDAIRRTLTELQLGRDLEFLSGYQPDIAFQESTNAFMNGAALLHRWDFDGAPTGNDVPVILFFKSDESEQEESEEKRVYTVKGSAGRFTISRKSG